MDYETLVHSIFGNKYILKKIFYFIRVHNAICSNKGYSYYDLPMFYYFNRQQSAEQKSSKSDEFVKRLQYHTNREPENGFKIFNLNHSHFFRFYTQNSNLELFKTVYNEIGPKHIVKYFMTRTSQMFHTPNREVLDFLLNEHPELFDQQPKHDHDISINSALIFYQFLMENQHLKLFQNILKTEHIKYVLCTNALLSANTDNLAFILKNNLVPDNTSIKLNMIREIITSGKYNHFQVLKEFNPSCLQRQFMHQIYPMSITNLPFSDGHCKILYEFYKIDNLEPVYDVGGVLDYHTSEPLSFILNKFMDPGRIDGINKVISPACFKFLLENRAVTSEMNIFKMIRNSPLFYNNIHMVREFTSKLMSEPRNNIKLVNCTELPVFKHLIENTNVVISDSFLNDPGFQDTEILDYLLENSGNGTRVVISHTSIKMAIHYGNFEIFKRLYHTMPNQVHDACLTDIHLSPNSQIIEFILSRNPTVIDKFIQNLYMHSFKSFEYLICNHKKKLNNEISLCLYEMVEYNPYLLNLILKFHEESVKCRSTPILESIIDNNEFGLLHQVMENRDHPLLKNGIRLTNVKKTLSYIQATWSFKMLVMLFHYGILKIKKHLNLLVRVMNSDENYQAILYLFRYFPSPIQHQIFYQSIKISILQNYNYKPNNNNNSLIYFYQHEMKYQTNRELITSNPTTFFVKRKLSQELLESFKTSLSAPMLEYLEKQNIFEVLFKNSIN
ncbi:hypothetical protein DLAC_08128 [Tieghemostelium lacteum]|uniref:Uncharacterized protein n=1 Tax=Tieghemostelium lacteum TaxID=361077 RepID=A0A151ZB98_TIELA|nr:hypothetical protein DLAC_08128 [Tieghemostelium lacteum]|eukprot:KYQ91205.1 hypothetical protein DLAC_08128 [Tieghemostelium lacteum]